MNCNYHIANVMRRSGLTMAGSRPGTVQVQDEFGAYVERDLNAPGFQEHCITAIRYNLNLYYELQAKDAEKDAAYSV